MSTREVWETVEPGEVKLGDHIAVSYNGADGLLMRRQGVADELYDSPNGRAAIFGTGDRVLWHGGLGKVLMTRKVEA